MRDGVELVADHYRPLTSKSRGHTSGPRTLRPRVPGLGALRVRLRVTRLPRRRAKRSRHIRLRWRLRPVQTRDHRRGRHRRVAARPAVVHRYLRHDRGVLPGLHPVGAVDRSAAGDGGRGHHRRSARHQRTALGHWFIRAQRFPRMESRGRPPGTPPRGQGHRASPSGHAEGGARDRRAAGRSGGPNATRRRRAVVRVLARAPRARRPVLGTASAARGLGSHRDPGAVALRLAGPVHRTDAGAVCAVARAGGARGRDHRPVEPLPHAAQGCADRAARNTRLARHPPRG